MPFYEYECQSCKFYTELMQKISDPPLTKCPSCGKKTMQKLISAPVFRLKGAGWYETDFKGENENKRNLAGADKEESKPAQSDAGAAKPSDGKTEAKPAAAGETKAAPAPAEPKREIAGSGRSSMRAVAAKGQSQGKVKAAARASSRPASRTKAKTRLKAKGKTGKGRR
jgi:putative FmdB family regulatory protein